ncbi:MAG: peptidoglycan DD-metalloendopeptidase family protein [Alphaproteobacteria bacterium]|nr:peptidoglycan DD-metalloendopeptidase family protein [Alphaproteobacteria bacterium]
MRAIAAGIVLLLLTIGPALAVELSGSLTQGALITGTAPAGAAVAFEGRTLRVDPQTGTFVFGIGRDHDADATLMVTHPDGRVETKVLEIMSRQWRIERINGLPPSKVTPPPEVLARIRREGALISASRSRDTAAMAFADGFILPAKGRLSGFYGSQRILNGKPRRPHLGLDVAAPVGAPVHAAAAGEVVLAEADLFYTGGTVTIDHGHGLTTIYSHLNSVDVEVGVRVAQGDFIGTIGATGRATGPHLDWRINWFNVRLDPQLVLNNPLPSGEGGER